MQPLTNFAKVHGADGAFTKHENSDYHKNAVLNAKDFSKNENEPELNVINRIDAERVKQV